MSEIDYEARVKKGAALLDEKFPGWEDVIDIDYLDVESGTDCVTAQLAGEIKGDRDFYTGMHMLDLTAGRHNDGSYTEHGFNAECPTVMPPGYNQREIYGRLNRLWREEIAARKVQEPVTQ